MAPASSARSLTPDWISRPARALSSTCRSSSGNSSIWASFCDASVSSQGAGSTSTVSPTGSTGARGAATPIALTTGFSSATTSRRSRPCGPRTPRSSTRVGCSTAWTTAPAAPVGGGRESRPPTWATCRTRPTTSSAHGGRRKRSAGLHLPRDQPERPVRRWHRARGARDVARGGVQDALRGRRRAGECRDLVRMAVRLRGVAHRHARRRAGGVTRRAAAPGATRPTAPCRRCSGHSARPPATRRGR